MFRHYSVHNLSVHAEDCDGESMTEKAARPELTEMLCFDIYAASRAVTAVYRSLLADLGLTYPQYLVLVVLWSERSVTIKELGELLHLDYGTLSPLLRRMEANGVLVRQRGADDERSVTLQLTTAGRELALRTSHVQAAIQAATGLTAKQAVELQRTLRSVAESATGYLPTEPVS